MNFHFNAFSILLLISGVATLLIGLFISHRSTGMVKWFASLMFCIAIWGISYAFELSSYPLTQMLLWINIEYIGIAFLPAMWIYFIVKFMGKGKWMNVRNHAIILTVPVVTLLMVWTNSLHHLYYARVSADNAGPFPLLAISPGPWYYVHTAYFYFMLALGIGLLVNKFRNSDIAFKRQIRAILLGVSLPWIVNFIYLLGIRPINHIDLTPFAFIATSVSIAYALFRYRLFDVIPFARERVIEAIHEGIIVLDKEGRVIDMNPAMRAFLPGYLTEIIGEPFVDILPEHQQLHKLAGDRTDNRIELEINDRFYEVAVTRTSEGKEGNGAVILIFWDITERKNAKEKIEGQAEQLRDLNHLKDRLFSIVAHDLRGPIASLAALMGMAENNQTSEQEFRTMLSVLSRNVDYTSAMLENLLHWSLSQLGGHSVNPRKFDLAPMVHEKLKLHEKRAADKQIKLVNNVCNATLLYADPDMIGIVLRNLFSNAIKFCKRNDIITVSAVEDSNIITICVADTGTGIDEETLNKLFGNESVTTYGTSNEKGTGLGLKLCKEFIEKNEGILWIESELGKGSRFFFTLRKA
jgi:PAS domain S-box-containing protein